MAHIYGKSGESALNVSMEKRERVLWASLLVMVYGAMAAGVLVGVTFSQTSTVRYLSFAAIIITFVLVRIWLRRHSSFFEDRLRGARAWRRGYEGERVIGELLESDLPDKYHVFNDLHFPGRRANIDHIVVGPTGVFVLDTKNWRGVVEWDADGKKILLNGEEQDATHTIMDAALDVHNKLETLTNRHFFVRPVLVFPLAKVVPRFKMNVELQQDNYLIDKCLDNCYDKSKNLSDSDIDIVVKALRALFRDNIAE